MITSNIQLGKNIRIEKDASINNIKIGDNCIIAGGVKIFGAESNVLEMGEGCIIAMNSFIEGFNAKIVIGDYVSIGINSVIISGSGPTASLLLQKIFPIVKGNITIGSHSWIGANSIIITNVNIGKFCIVASNSFVNSSFPDYSIVGGTPAKLIRTLTPSEIEILHSND
jgi:acetyltransferase-like isoleucine patch superfamily enzyme